MLVERTSDAKIGQIIIAEIDGEWTLKYFTKENGRICLLPANEAYPPIYPENELRIAARVLSTIRRYDA